MLKYQFPAVKGYQAGKDYYICMVPLGLMSKIFVTDSGDVPAEYRAQRKLNEARIPEICGYILSNRNSYVFSALAASVDGDMKFVPADNNENAGILEIDMTASFLINDGQHRKAAIDAAISWPDKTVKPINAARETAMGSRSPAGPRRLRNSDAHKRIAAPKAFCVLWEHPRPSPKSGKVCRFKPRPRRVSETCGTLRG